MFDNYIEEFKVLGKKEQSYEYGLINYHVRIGELKKIIKRDGLKNNYELGIQMVNSDVYDLVNMGFIFLNTKSLTKEEVIALSQKVTEPYLVERHISVFAAENEKFEELFAYFLKHNLTVYYAAVAGRVMMDPSYNLKYLSQVLDKIEKNIKVQTEIGIIREMNYCLATIAVQVPDLTTKALMIYDNYIDDLNNYKLYNAHDWYSSSKSRGLLAKKRKSCRC